MVYGACYSGDRCWYRCKVQKQIDDSFHVTYIDYGNEEVVDRSDLVELPEDLQSTALAQRYKFWGINLTSDQGSPQYSQGKSFLQNLIYGKKLRVNVMSDCFGGTILVKAFQGNLDIGEEVVKFKFAIVTIPGNIESLSPSKKQTGLWLSRIPQGDSDNAGYLGYMPKLRPVSSNQKPEVIKEQSTSKTLMAASVPEAERELVKESQQPNAEKVIEQLCSQITEQMLNEAELKLQRAREEVEEKMKEINKLEKEKSDLQNQADNLQQQLKEARLELQKALAPCPSKDECVEVNMELTECKRFSQLAKKVEVVRRNRDSGKGTTAEECLSESIPVVLNNRIVMPLISETLELAWEDYRQELKQLKECQSKGELEDLVSRRNQARGVLLTAIDDYLEIVASLPITERMNTLKNIRSSLMAVFGSVSTNDVQDQSLEDFEKTPVSLEAVSAGVDELLEQTESVVSEELNTKFFEQNFEDMKIMSTACYMVMKHIQKEEHLLCNLTKMYDDNKKADDLDLPEILRKKDEIAETRNALFEQIQHEREQYVKLSELVKGDFPELLLLYPEADIDNYLLSEGLLIKSLDRDIFDAEPMRELSGRRPLVCTEFQHQKVVLKGYSVDEESEVRMIKQAAQYHKAQNQHPSFAMPLLGLFFGKSDPLAYIMVPYYSSRSLKAVQKHSPLTPPEIGKVMRGVLRGLQCLHESCITHASLNANNMFVLNREQGIVGDFDFTKTPEQRAVDCGMVTGSISLVAPELKRSKPPSPATDMYAFGGLMLWLYAPDWTGDMDNEQHCPRLSGLQLMLNCGTFVAVSSFPVILL
ncbi:serine/threonine-protein kinase 31 [Silurus asotus]|uniref:Serine/threonine-protein kinase 31 n=1 Tax=Silurus asotus TaxID=30991 RepID=A0AAD5AMV6_SILAS|nr:serine/threonine-protein kinase 31 [Silurus asotus]